jgi:hypothetical protein
MLLDLVDKNAEALRTMGARAIEEANLAGVPAYFMDPRLGEGIIRQMPDGTLQRVEVGPDGKDTVLETLARRR